MMALFGVGLTGLGCVPCGGSEKQTLTFRAAFQPTQGGVAWTDELMLTEGFDYTPERLWWADAIHDASTVSAAAGQFVVDSGEAGFGLSAPFPVSAGQELPIVTMALGVGYSPFGSTTDRGASLYPTDAAAIRYWDLPRPPCSRAMIEACDAERAFKDAQVASGTLRVADVRPLRFEIQATVSFPVESGWAPVALAGPITFGVSEGEYCYNP